MHTDRHVPVLLRETIEGLALKPESTVVDATFGSGGHTREILKHLGERGVLIALDADSAATAHGQDAYKGDARVTFANENFRNIASVLEARGKSEVNGLIADLGWRSEQFLGDKATHMQKGFSFQNDEPLLMTFGNPEAYPFTARDIVNEWEEGDIKNVLRGYGEERYAAKIAKRIVEMREKKPIETTNALVEIVESAVPGRYRRGKMHPATKTFQALRIAVNDELDALTALIKNTIPYLSVGGRLAIITFHSIEDRIVKHQFRDLAHDDLGIVITKKPITATEAEIAQNKRARSAKLRIFEKK